MAEEVKNAEGLTDDERSEITNDPRIRPLAPKCLPRFEFEWNDTLMLSMMFLYKTRTCPLFKSGHCPAGPDCFDAHQKHKHLSRRRPYARMDVSPNRRCAWIGWHLHLSEESVEKRYHPLFYKTRPCNDAQFKQIGICSHGPKCWMYHLGQNDRRDLETAYIPRSILDIDRKIIHWGSAPPKEFFDWIHWKNKQKLKIYDST